MPYSDTVTTGITIIAAPPVDPERCRSLDDGQSGMQPHLASPPPAALASCAAARRVKGRHPVLQAMSSWQLLPRHQHPHNKTALGWHTERFSSVGRAPTWATKLSMQLDPESGTICWRTSDSRTRQFVIEPFKDSRWRQLYLVSETKAQCVFFWLRFRNPLTYYLLISFINCLY